MTTPTAIVNRRAPHFSTATNTGSKGENQRPTQGYGHIKDRTVHELNAQPRLSL